MAHIQNVGCRVTERKEYHPNIEKPTWSHLVVFIIALFACLIIRIFQLVFSTRIVFFSHNESANCTFNHDFSAKRTDSLSMAFQRSERAHYLYNPSFIWSIFHADSTYYVGSNSQIKRYKSLKKFMQMKVESKGQTKIYGEDIYKKLMTQKLTFRVET
jgi:hypothetical protein